MLSLFRLISLLIVVYSLPSFAQQTDQELIRALRIEGTDLRLRGHYAPAKKITERLKRDFPDTAVGYTVSLNTLLTLLSWDPEDITHDQLIRDDAAKTLSICEREKHQDNYQAYYDCGQAHFLLTYLNAVRGNYYQAGVQGNKTIKNLERALVIKPDLTDAKLHLGTAYYFADNLPYYVKAFSQVLWFVPTGSSSKSLPYIRQVTETGTFFRDVSKYIYSDLLINGNEDDRQQATLLLRDLIDRYPENRRFHLRYISLFIERGHYEQSLAAIQEFIETAQRYKRQSSDLTLASLWATRAHLGLNDVKAAIAEFDRINDTTAPGDFPSWGKAWFQLTRAQMSDLKNSRTHAIVAYEQIIGSADKTPANVLAAAHAGLKTPFSLPILP